MEVFIRNVPEQATERALAKQLEPSLIELSIFTYYCQRKGKTAASITFLHKSDGNKFLGRHGDTGKNSSSTWSLQNPTPKKIQLMVFNRPIYCCLSTQEPDLYDLRALKLDEKKRQFNDKAQPPGVQGMADTDCTVFPVSSVSCGIWSYEGSELVYNSHVTWTETGKAKFGFRALIVTTDRGKRIEFNYQSIENITVGQQVAPSFTLSLSTPPKFSEMSVEVQLAQFLQISGNQKYNKITWTRLPALDSNHEKVASGCFVYRFSVRSHSAEDFDKQLRELKKLKDIPSIIGRKTRVRQGDPESFSTAMKKLSHTLSESYWNLPFMVLFQMQKLAQNGYLHPLQVLDLAPEVIRMNERSGSKITANAIRKIFLQIPFAGPGTDAQEFEHQTLIEHLRANERQTQREESYIIEASNDNIAVIFRATVTPAGLLLKGPEPETKNRVLRKYSEHLDYFLRVQFADENGEPVRYHPSVSNDKIFYGRFKNVLTHGINIAGRKYGFLGFSHSSLRSQTCWFMAPFVRDKVLQWDRQVIADLGDFSKIRCPAKCAARIGQAFSDTAITVTLGSAKVRSISDVKRNERVFSDGVGTVSPPLLKLIWDTLSIRRLERPTSFQIRYSGAKGMISLDSRLGDNVVLCLRPSMIKFPGSDSSEIEICGAAYKPLPMYLNRQTIKILEELGAEPEFFMNLQDQAVERLRCTTADAINAANFLKDHSIGECFYLSLMIKRLSQLGMFFQYDPFLRDMIETAVLIELRALKHRTRILVEKGFTLYGIMDETGILEEDEIFVITENQKGKRSVLVEKEVIITRSPALHPGDVRLAKAVSVPKGSPLLKLSNVVCFSQKGSRDLPSMLSGGDLDGDLYNIIWDRNVSLKRTAVPADYPRQEPFDIGREVNKNDMTDFFVQFMATDQLGRIATLHQILADQREDGIFNKDCLTLAEMHSTAVDFSKTGIPVELSKMPKYSRARPDFMSPGPHVTIEDKAILLKETPRPIVADDDEYFQVFRYYESEKILGKLYRAIDEGKLLREIQHYGKHSDGHRGIKLASSQKDDNMMRAVWNYVQGRCRLIEWRHHVEWAREIKELYEDCLLIIMTEYSQHPSKPLSELEVLVGNILGKTGAQSRQQRDLSTTMKQRFEADVAFIVNSIVKDNMEYSSDALPRSMACLSVSLEMEKTKIRGEELRSFKYITAALCLKEMRQFGTE